MLLRVKPSAAVARTCRRGGNSSAYCLLDQNGVQANRRHRGDSHDGGNPANEAGKQPQGSTAPLEGLSAVDSIVPSNDDYSIWLTWQSEHFRIRYPDHCRAAGRAEGLSGPSPATAALELPMHPDAPRVYNVLHPMCWVLGLTGHEVERTPVEVSLPAAPVFAAELVRWRTDYSFARPALRVNLPAQPVLQTAVRRLQPGKGNGDAGRADRQGERARATGGIGTPGARNRRNAERRSRQSVRAHVKTGSAQPKCGT